ncbi:hypothetical protein D3C85_1736630 [compost metagenome]
MQYPLGGAANEPADAMVMMASHHNHIDGVGFHEQCQDLGRVPYPHVTLFGGDPVALRQYLESVALGLVQGLGQV